jgi:hypothetical protein
MTNGMWKMKVERGMKKQETNKYLDPVQIRVLQAEYNGSGTEGKKGVQKIRGCIWKKWQVKLRRHQRCKI